MDDSQAQDIDERYDAQVLDSRIIDQIDTLLHVLSQQVILTHNRALATKSAATQQRCAELIALLTERYMLLLNG